MGDKRVKCKQCSRHHSFFRFTCQSCKSRLRLPTIIFFLFMIILISSLIVIAMNKQDESMQVSKDETETIEKEEEKPQSLQKEEGKYPSIIEENIEYSHQTNEQTHIDFNKSREEVNRKDFVPSKQEKAENIFIQTEQNNEPKNKLFTHSDESLRNQQESKKNVDDKKELSYLDDKGSANDQEHEQEQLQHPTQVLDPKEDSSSLINEHQFTGIFAIFSHNEKGGYLSQGTGFLINERGDIVTNGHVVENIHNKLKVQTANQLLLDARLIGYDDTLDVSLIRVESGLPSIRPLTLNYSVDKPYMNAPVVTYGTRFKKEYENRFIPMDESIVETVEFEMSEGEIINQTSFAIIDEPFEYNDMYTITAKLKRGNSGGPLILKESGEVIGINSAVLDLGDSGFYEGYSLPIYQVKEKLEMWSNQPMNEIELQKVQKVQEEKIKEVSKEEIQQIPSTPAVSEQKNNELEEENKQQKEDKGYLEEKLLQTN